MHPIREIYSLEKKVMFNKILSFSQKNCLQPPNQVYIKQPKIGILVWDFFPFCEVTAMLFTLHVTTAQWPLYHTGGNVSLRTIEHWIFPNTSQLQKHLCPVTFCWATMKIQCSIAHNTLHLLWLCVQLQYIKNKLSECQFPNFVTEKSGSST